MASATTATATRPTATLSANGSASSPMPSARGNLQDSVYRPNGQNNANQQANRGPSPEQQQQQQQQQQQPQQQQQQQQQLPPQQLPQVPQPQGQNQGPPLAPDIQAIMQNPALMAMFANMWQHNMPRQQFQAPPPPMPAAPAGQNGPRPQRASTPIGTAGRRPPGSPSGLTNDFRDLRAASVANTPRSQLGHPLTVTSTPHYIPAAEQALQIHKNAAEVAKNQAEMFTGCAEMMQMMADAMPNPPAEAQNLIAEFTQKAIWAHRDAQAKRTGIQNAQRVTQYYETPIMKPDFPYPDPERHVRVNHKELIMLTGYFDPKDPSAVFKHTWQKLLDYARMNEYQEEHYMQALGAILKGEAMRSSLSSSLWTEA